MAKIDKPIRLPIWKCNTEEDTGLNEIPKNGLIVFQNKLYFVLNEEGITDTTTFKQALEAEQIVRNQIGGYLPKVL